MGSVTKDDLRERVLGFAYKFKESGMSSHDATAACRIPFSTDHAFAVAVFMVAANQRLPEKPEIPTEEVLNLRLRLLVEEVCEFAWACGYMIGEADPDKEPADKLGKEYGIELRRIGHKKPDYEGMVDAAADIAFVNIGNMLSLGAGDIDLMNNVCDANLRKFEGDWSIKDGKLVKPSDWTPPVYECVTKFNAGE